MRRSGGRAVSGSVGWTGAASRSARPAVHLSTLLLAACTPVTTRPDFRPDPRALVVTLDARPERVTAALDSLVPAESLEVAHSNVRDGYVETAWYETLAHRTRLTVEPVYRPRYDPSRVERELEVIVPKEHEGYKIAQRLVDKLKERFGVP